LDAAEKGYTRLSDAMLLLDKLNTSAESSFDVKSIVDSFYNAMDDDFNAPMLIANLFEAVRRINLVNDGKETLSATDRDLMKREMTAFVLDVLGLQVGVTNSDSKLAPVMELVLELRQQARANKDWTTSDKIRDGLAAAGITVKDSKEGTSWS
jgi:cysteinyl-tRNA synthetase